MSDAEKSILLAKIAITCAVLAIISNSYSRRSRSSMTVDEQEELQLFKIASMAKVAHELQQDLILTPWEFNLLKKYCNEGADGLWAKSLKEAFKDALPEVVLPHPWEPPEKALFDGLKIVVRS